MGAFLQSMGIQRAPSQALVKAPSADLIKSDNEFSPPEPEEIQIELDPEKLAEYEQMSKSCGFCKQAIEREKLSHFLKDINSKIYDPSKVNNFMGRCIKHAFKNLNLGEDLWWFWIELNDYRHPLPYRVANKIKTIHISNENAIFFVSDIVLITFRWIGDKNSADHINSENTKWQILPMKRKTEICFLKINSSADTLPEESLIIDAWRGPTFSDEEARI